MIHCSVKYELFLNTFLHYRIYVVKFPCKILNSIYSVSNRLQPLTYN